MVSHAAKRFWKSVALGLALGPVLSWEGVGHAQTFNQASTVAAVRDKDPATGKTDVPGKADDVETVRKLLQEGRKALKEGDKARAEKLARQAQAMKVSLPFWETDSPEKLLIDIGVAATPPKGIEPAKAQAKAAGKAPVTTPGKAPAKPPVSADPHVLVRQGYEALRAGKLDEAQSLAQQANSQAAKVRWGLFEDTPTKLLDDVQKARAARNKADSAKVLADARRLYEQGKLEDAKKLAYKANNMHGPYSIWDFGDKPEKLLAEIQTAEEKNRKLKVPPVPGSTGTAVAGVKKPGPMPDAVVKQTAAPPPKWPSDVKTADAKGASGPGSVTTAAATSPHGTSNNVMQVAGNAPKAVSPAKIQAQKLLAEGKGHQQAGRYLEARAKFQEAQKLNAEFGPNEESPDRCLVELAAAVVKQLDTTLRTTAGPLNTPEQRQRCEAQLAQARQLAAGFGLDTHPIDSRLAQLHSVSPMPGAMPVPAPAAVVQAPSGPSADGMIQGQAILDKARLELKRGQTELARQLATEVYNGPYGVQNEAATVLRSIDVEEHNQRVLTANRSYDAALAAYHAKDYAQAQAIFRQVDANLLAADKKMQIREVMLSCSRMEGMAKAAPGAPAPGPDGVMPAAALGTPAGGVAQAGATGITGLQGQKPTMTAPAEGDNLAAQIQAMQQIEYQRLRAEGLDVQSKAMYQFERGETDAALETLQGYLKKVKTAKLDPADIARLQRPIEAKEHSFKLLKAQKDVDTSIVSSKKNFLENRTREAIAQDKKQQQVKELMKQFDKLYKEGKYKEAELAAAKAHELDPDDTGTEAALRLAQVHGAVDDYETISKRRQKMFLDGMNEAEDVGPAVNNKNPVSIDPVALKIAQNRQKDKNGINVMRTLSEKDKEIEAKLAKPVKVNFQNVPLRQALDDLQAMAGMNIVLETHALAAETISPEQPVTLKVDDISLKSALNLLLNQVHLTYVKGDEVLKVTTEKAARGKLVTKVYSVADLVIPIDDYVLPESANFEHAMARVSETQRVNLTGGGTPMTNNRFQLQNGQPVGNGSGGGGGRATMTTTTDLPGAKSVQPGNVGSPMTYSASVSPTKQGLQDTLIKLITNCVAPQSWQEVGGAGTIDYFPIGLALVVNQTPDVQEQVADLLEALRRLQDLEVAVEVRMITLAETFFERIGLDFALNMKTDKNTSQFEPQLTTGTFKPAGQVNDFSPRNFIAGILPNSITNTGNAASFTSDLDVPIRSSSFQYAIPPFAYPNNPGFNGGLSLGLAFLSEIQVYMFMEAAQGDRRTNVMQAPKITLFNGQTSTITVSDLQFFVTNVNVVGFGGQIVYVPQVSPSPLGVSLTIQAVVSADRRFVRLNLSPNLTNLASAQVPLFPVTTFVTPVFEGGAQGQPIPFTQFVQLPAFSTVTIQTTVSIPDGGTVILGGLKTLSEGRNEFGPPVLSKLPYVNRLFKNVGYGREAQSLLLMVTPRIIINSEEEERQTGVVTSPAIQP